VDDDPVVCRSVTRCLERLGFVVKVVSSGLTALTTLATEQFDAVITDLHMPAMSGADFISELIQRDPSMGARIVLMSGDLHAEDTRKLIAQTGCRALSKPFQLAELALAVQSAAAGRHAVRQ
jgi:two-component system sensor histidine kinase EvgS